MEYLFILKNVADVRFGSANRFGAITGNGREKVLGQVMMLKDANSKSDKRCKVTHY
jgi:cobalt-zinc-cadmium resistance protein CzcA